MIVLFTRRVIVHYTRTVSMKILHHPPFGVVTPTFLKIMPKFQTPCPLYLAIYRPKLASILHLCLCDTSFSAIELYSGTLLLNLAN